MDSVNLDDCVHVIISDQTFIYHLVDLLSSLVAAHHLPRDFVVVLSRWKMLTKVFWIVLPALLHHLEQQLAKTEKWDERQSRCVTMSSILEQMNERILV